MVGARRFKGVELYNYWNGTRPLLNKPILPEQPQDFQGQVLRWVFPDVFKYFCLLPFTIHKLKMLAQLYMFSVLNANNIKTLSF